MANSQTASAFALETTLGTVEACCQGDRTIYVRFGLDIERDLLEEAREPLRVGKATIHGRAHLYLEPSGRWWTRGDAGYYYRADRPDKGVTTSQRKTVTTEISEAIRRELRAEPPASRFAPTLAKRLEASQREKMVNEAASRAATALELRALADQLDDQALELGRGGRVEYMRATLPSGADERVTMVRRADGELMPPLRKPPAIYGATDYPGHLGNLRPENRW